MYPEIFYGIGELKDFECHIELDSSLKSEMQTPHKVPSFEFRLKEE